MLTATARLKLKATFLVCSFILVDLCSCQVAIDLERVDGQAVSASPVSLRESTTVQTALAIVKCYESPLAATPVEKTGCKCNLDRTLPTNGPFDVWRLAGETDFKVYFVGTTTLDYDAVKSHDVIAKCVDTDPTQSATTTLEVDIIPNQQPVITDYPAAITTQFDANTGGIAVGTTLYQVTATDEDGDTLSYSMTQSPNSAFLAIGSSDGAIRTAVDLRTVTTDYIVCTVAVFDGQNTVSNFIVTVWLTNLNTRPYISNLPVSVNVSEDTATGLTLRTLAFGDDTDQGSTLEPVCSVDPSAESYKFTYDTNTQRLLLNTLTTGETLLDHESTSRYLITCVVTDGYLTSVDDVLTLYVDNVNEPPVFGASTYFCTMPESDAGVSSCELGLTVTDPESDTITTVELLTGNNSERFYYNRLTDRLTFNVDYDVDNSNMPTAVIITVYAVDSNKATGSAKIEINVQDANDNTCDFGAASVAQFSLNQGTSLGNLGSFTAPDADLTSPNNDVTYEMVSGFPTASLNYINVFGNGEINYVGLIPESEHGKSFSVSVRCKDGGSPSRSATGTVQVSYLTTTTSTTTTTTTTTTTATTTAAATTSKPSIWDEDAFVGVFAALMALLGLALLLALWYFCCRDGQLTRCLDRPQYDRGRMTPPRQVRPAQDEYYDGSRRGDDFFRTGPSRVSPNYKEHAWRSGDHFEDGLGYDSRPLSKSDVFLTGQTHRALPPPVERPGHFY